VALGAGVGATAGVGVGAGDAGEEAAVAAGGAAGGDVTAEPQPANSDVAAKTTRRRLAIRVASVAPPPTWPGYGPVGLNVPAFGS
jgi:hypothetical protein